MRLGVIDVGSNTVHLLVVDAHPGASPVPYHSERTTLRLMRFLDDDGAIVEEGPRLLADMGIEAMVPRPAVGGWSALTPNGLLVRRPG